MEVPSVVEKRRRCWVVVYMQCAVVVLYAFGSILFHQFHFKIKTFHSVFIWLTVSLCEEAKKELKL